ncbi:MAG: hypothetical protein JNL63_08290 [Bacteroidia bacterium]|nr:hypothetical protein [Bacteroidia bacterium]
MVLQFGSDGKGLKLSFKQIISLTLKKGINHKMKTYCIPALFAAVLFCAYCPVFKAQNIAINNTGATADTSAGLDIDFTNKSLLIPRVAFTRATDATTIIRPASSLMVYNSGTGGLTNTGFLHNVGTSAAPRWVNISNSWSTTGNSGTADGINFIGTNDSIPFGFKVNNYRSGIIDPAGDVFFGYKAGAFDSTQYDVAIGFNASYKCHWGGQVAIGYKSLSCGRGEFFNNGIGYRTLYCNSRERSVAIGADALYNSTDGNYNTAIGAEAMFGNTLGFYNTATGYRSLYTQSTNQGLDNATGAFALFSANGSGLNNVAEGFKALYTNTSGTNNTAVGDSALFTNLTGTNNTCLGQGADVTANNLTNATAIGYNAKVACSNCLVLGGTGADAVKVGVGVTTPLSTLTVSGSIAGKYRAGNTIAMAATDLFIKLTAAGGSTLPAANAVTAGTIVIISNTTAAAITLSRAGADTMCNIGVGCAQTSVSIPAYTAVRYTSDGISVWNGW